jgi:hypothetical protein
MSISVLRATGHLLAPVAAAVLLTGVSLGAEAAGSKGIIAFETGKDLSKFHFRLPVDGSNYLEQSFEVDKGCKIYPIGDELVLLTAYPFKGSDPGVLGYVATSLGVYDGPQGTACGRISYVKGEAIELAVGSGAGDANAFDRLELDVEVKGDVRLKLEVEFDGSITNTYYLRTGSEVLGDLDPNDKELNPTVTNFNCSVASDSGPDAGPGDNCRWIISDIGHSFKITPEAGEFSLEGGGDFDNPLPHRSFIYLTRADGILDCGDTAYSTDTTDISCEVTRLDNASCTPVPYVFREVATSQGQACVLETDMGTQQLVANLFVTYAPEPQVTTLSDGTTPVGDLNDLDVWAPSELTKVVFIDSSEAFDIPPCLGFTLTNIDVDLDPQDPNDQLVGPDPIPEIASGGYDRIGTNGNIIDFACAFMRREVYGTVFTTENGQAVSKPTTRVEEGIQFWGDPSFSRPGVSSGNAN